MSFCASCRVTVWEIAQKGRQRSSMAVSKEKGEKCKVEVREIKMLKISSWSVKW